MTGDQAAAPEIDPRLRRRPSRRWPGVGVSLIAVVDSLPNTRPHTAGLSLEPVDVIEVWVRVVWVWVTVAGVRVSDVLTSDVCEQQVVTAVQQPPVRRIAHARASPVSTKAFGDVVASVPSKYQPRRGGLGPACSDRSHARWESRRKGVNWFHPSVSVIAALFF